MDEGDEAKSCCQGKESDGQGVVGEGGGDVTVEVVSGGSVARASARPGGSGGVVPPSAPAR